MVFKIDKTSLPCGSNPGPEYLPVVMNQYQDDTVFHSRADFPEPPDADQISDPGMRNNREQKPIKQVLHYVP